VTLSSKLDENSRNKTLVLHFSLTTENVRELQERVAKGQIVPPDEMAEKYSGSAANAKKLSTWLKSQGFKIIETSEDHTSVYAKATVAQIEKSLGVKMQKVTYKGKTKPSAASAPKLPRDVGDAVIAIDGLQPWIQAVKHNVPRNKARSVAPPQANTPVPRAASVTLPTYKIIDILKAYDADGLQVTGVGQTIAILIDTFPEMTDLQLFWQKNGLAVQPTQIQLINVQGATTKLPPREGEETLDAEWASGIAPGATVRVYATGSLRYTDIDRALDRIYLDAQKSGGPRHLSISLGLREDLVSPNELKVEATKFLKLAAIGVTTFVSSGDAGSNPDASGHGRSDNNDNHVEYEASDPYVIAVGGTTLQFDPNSGKVLSETAWNDSGGGVSAWAANPRPSWQNSYSQIDSPLRLVPDVSSVADPNPGAFVILNKKEWPVGGTSWSAPMWAGFCALIAEAREKQGKPPLGFLAPKLYQLQANTGFRDVTSGSNGAYQAGTGWDPVTGLGVPNVKMLIQELP
jgi:kumamolisin